MRMVGAWALRAAEDAGKPVELPLDGAAQSSSDASQSDPVSLVSLASAEPRPPASRAEAERVQKAAEPVAKSNHATDHAAAVSRADNGSTPEPAASRNTAEPPPREKRNASVAEVQRPKKGSALRADAGAMRPASEGAEGVAVDEAPGDRAAAEKKAIPWRKAIRQAIGGLQKQLQDDQLSDEDRSRLEAYLALLHVVAQEHEKAVETLQDFPSEQELEFWRQLVLAMGILLDSDDLPRFKYRVESASEYLRKGQQALTMLGPLIVKNLAFCTEVAGFGDYTPFDTYVFRPGQQVLLYVEVENFTVEQVDAGAGSSGSAIQALGGKARMPMYETELQGRYEILDSEQQTVTSRSLPLDRNRCRNRRSDYFIPYLLRMPKDIRPGSYSLELILEDKKGKKFGSGVIEFRIR